MGRLAVQLSAQVDVVPCHEDAGMWRSVMKRVRLSHQGHFYERFHCHR